MKKVYLTEKQLLRGSVYSGKCDGYTYMFKMPLKGNSLDVMRTGDRYYQKKVLDIRNMENITEVPYEKAEHFEACEKAGKYVAGDNTPKFVIKTASLTYVIATEKNGKVSWSDEIKPILHLLNDTTTITTTGAVSKKPKNLKALKALIK